MSKTLETYNAYGIISGDLADVTCKYLPVSFKKPVYGFVPTTRLLSGL
jgi:hypothetical protein